MKLIKRVLLALGLAFAGALLALAALLGFSREFTIDTRMELIACAVAAQDYRNAQGKWPESQGKFDAEVSTALGMGGGGRADEWGRPFLFAIDPHGDEAVLQTHGEDGKPGTHDGDLRVMVTPNQLTVFSK